MIVLEITTSKKLELNTFNVENTAMNRYLKSSILILIVMVAIPQLAYSKSNGKRFTISLYDTYFRNPTGNAAIVDLKRELKKQHPHINPKKLRLKKLILIAKSRKGHGRVQLQSGQGLSAAQQIPGHKRDFHNPKQSTFHRVGIKLPGSGAKGYWQLHLTGQVIVREIKLIVGQRGQGGSFALSNRVWGTRMEGERYCGSPSSNAADGWGRPQNICSVAGVTRYTHGYRPIKLYVKPEITPLHHKNIHRVNELVISVTALARNRDRHGYKSVSFGIDIAGKTHRSRFSLAPAGSRDGRPHTQKLRVRGHWSVADLRNSKVWVLPNQSSTDLKLKHVQLKVAGY